MEYEFEIEAIPPSVNSYWLRSARGSYISKKGREFKELIGWYLKTQDIKKISNRIKVSIELKFKGKRKRDIDNYNKGILDSFNGRLWEDDEQIDELSVKKSYNNKVDSFVIKIKEI